MTTRDASHTPSDTPAAWERAARAVLNDPRDVPFVVLSVQCALVVIPLATALFVMRRFPWWLGVGYLAIVFLGFVDRFILMLHNTSHRPLFKREHAWLNRIIPWVIGPFFGESPETYFVHHVGMHHPENNLEADVSSTMRYQRDSLLHFLAYFFRFFFAGLFELGQYLVQRRRSALLRRMLVGEGLYLATVIALGFYSLQATLFVFVLPLVMVRFLMMAGNWGQHAFIDANAPGNCYRNSITCIDSRYNRRCFNDGYHIGHHLKATMHWTELPQELVKNGARYVEERAFVFSNIDFFGVWLLLVTKQHRKLARHWVHLGDGAAATEDEIVAQMRERLAPIQ